MTRILIAAAVALGLALPAAAQTPLNDYPAATPVLTDKVWGVDDPAGTWSAKLFEFGAIRDLFQDNLTGLQVSSGTLTAGDPWLFEQTWNEGATTFTGLRVNVTDTASASGSKLLDLQIGGVSQFSVQKDGLVTFANGNFIDSKSGNTLNIRAGGTNNIINSTGFLISDTRSLGWTDVLLHHDAANTLALRNGTAAQTFNIYNTFTDASNYERGVFGWDSNALKIGTEKSGTGSNRAISFVIGGSARFLLDAGLFKPTGTGATDDLGEPARPWGDFFTRRAIHTQDTGELTIATGAVTATGSYHTVDTEGDAASDDLDTISGCTDGHQLVIQAEHTDRTVVAKDGTGNLALAGDMTLDNAEDTLTLLCAGALSAWVETARSDNGT